MGNKRELHPHNTQHQWLSTQIHTSCKNSKSFHHRQISQLAIHIFLSFASIAQEPVPTRHPASVHNIEQVGVTRVKSFVSF